MAELNLLRVLLLVSFAMAPLGTHRLLVPHSRRGTAAHAAALACTAVGLFTPVRILSVAWLVFCAASFVRFLRHRATQLRWTDKLARDIPFLFSNIAAVWLVGGANGLHILGYGEVFSYYAALHSTVLGWMMVGSLAVLATQERPYRNLHLVSTFVCFGCFLLVAVGIESLPAVKPIGVLGLSVAIPTAQLAFVQSVWRNHNKPAFALGCTSLVGLAFTLTLAWHNELAVLSFPAVLGIRAMTSVHGVINALVVAPCFLLAVTLEARGHAKPDRPLGSRPA